jgi:glycosyltransferase involved in cell wall biosynthesis
MSQPSVLLTTDGTYPCYPGGVSVWCDQLMRQLSDTPFHVFAVAYSPSHTPAFPRLENVITQQVLPLWGTEEPGVREESLAAALRRKLITSQHAIRSRFLDAFELCVQCILDPSSPPEELADALIRMHLYFREHDYARTIASSETWDCFLGVSCQHYAPSSRPTLEEATTCLRWLARFLAVTAVSFPDTEIVHTSMSGLAGIPGVIQKRLNGSQFLLTEHGIFLRELYLSLAKSENSSHCRRFLFSFYEAVARMNYRFADAVSALCEFNRNWQIRMGAIPKRIHITPNGVDPVVFHPPESVASRPSGEPVVLTMARIYPLKGIDDLLRSAALVLERLPKVRFRILGEVGDHEYYQSCVELAGQLGIEGNVEWGRSSEPAIEYRSADLFCLPSISEAMPYCVLEAMFSGCPVVATDVGGMGEMLNGTGLVVPPRDPQAMADAMISLLSAEDGSWRNALARRALLHARASYTIEQCSDRFRRIYAQLASPSRAAKLSAAG